MQAPCSTVQSASDFTYSKKLLQNYIQKNMVQAACFNQFYLIAVYLKMAKENNIQLDLYATDDHGYCMRDYALLYNNLQMIYFLAFKHTQLLEAYFPLFRTATDCFNVSTPKGLANLCAYPNQIQQLNTKLIETIKGNFLHGDCAKYRKKLCKLLNNGAKINYVDKNGNSLAHFAMAQNSYILIELLADYGSTDTHVNKYGKSPYDLGDKKIGKFFKQALAVNQELFFAVQQKSYDNVVVAINKGASVKARDEYGNTPYMFAQYHNNEKIMDLLLEEGAKKGIKNCEGSCNPVFRII